MITYLIVRPIGHSMHVIVDQIRVEETGINLWLSL